MQPISYARHRFPPDVIRHAVWLYLRFTFSYRDVEDLLAERGLTVSNESNRRWVSNSGRSLPKTCVKPDLNPTVVGISMKWWSQSLDGKGTCGALSTAKERFSRFWSSPNATRPRRCGCCGQCFDGRASFRWL